MTPICHCLERAGRTSGTVDPASAQELSGALNDFEASDQRRSERVVALEAVLQKSIGAAMRSARSGRFLRVSIERRQNRLARRVYDRFATISALALWRISYIRDDAPALI